MKTRKVYIRAIASGQRSGGVGETLTGVHSLVLTLQKQSNCLNKGHHSLQLTSYSPIVLLV